MVTRKPALGGFFCVQKSARNRRGAARQTKPLERFALTANDGKSPLTKKIRLIIYKGLDISREFINMRMEVCRHPMGFSGDLPPLSLGEPRPASFLFYSAFLSLPSGKQKRAAMVRLVSSVYSLFLLDRPTRLPVGIRARLALALDAETINLPDAVDLAQTELIQILDAFRLVDERHVHQRGIAALG
jgi:hypothetical protein